MSTPQEAPQFSHEYSNDGDAFRGIVNEKFKAYYEINPGLRTIEGGLVVPLVPPEDPEQPPLDRIVIHRMSDPTLTDRWAIMYSPTGESTAIFAEGGHIFRSSLGKTQAGSTEIAPAAQDDPNKQLLNEAETKNLLKAIRESAFEL